MDPDIWDLIVLGRGAAARYYLTTIDRSLFPNILVIGLKDPWGGERGYNHHDPKDPVNKINQTKGMIASFDGPEPEFSKEMVDRLTFSAETGRIIDAHCTRVERDRRIVDVQVSRQFKVPQCIRASGSMRVFSVVLDNDDTYAGKKVVVATGAGPHREPPEVKGLTATHPDVVMDMDTFARKAGTFKNPAGLKIFIHGWNAAIDTADTAKYNKFKVVWLVKDDIKEIPVLATPHQVGAREAARSDVKKYKGAPKRGDAAFKVTVTRGASNKVLVNLGGEKIWGDYYVYGMGQDPDGAMEGVIPETLRKSLEPIYDINQRFGNAWETVLGFKLENSDWDNGFEVVGALCTQVARMDGGVKHTYLKELETRIAEVRKKVLQHLMNLQHDIKAGVLFEDFAKLRTRSVKELETARDAALMKYPTWDNRVIALCNLLVNYVLAAKHLSKPSVGDADLNRVTSILTPSTVAHAQLGGIRIATAAQNGFAKTEASFSQDDRTMLRASIAYNYPFVSDQDAEQIIKEMIEGRRDEKLEGYGYDTAQRQQFANRLEMANRKGYQPLTQPKMFGSGPTKTLVPTSAKHDVKVAPRVVLTGW